MPRTTSNTDYVVVNRNSARWPAVGMKPKHTFASIPYPLILNKNALKNDNSRIGWMGWIGFVGMARVSESVIAEIYPAYA